MVGDDPRWACMRLDNTRPASRPDATSTGGNAGQPLLDRTAVPEVDEVPRHVGPAHRGPRRLTASTQPLTNVTAGIPPVDLVALGRRSSS